jgi:hypothetical protein
MLALWDASISRRTLCDWVEQVTDRGRFGCTGERVCRFVECDALAPGKLFDFLADRAVKGPGVIFPVGTVAKSDNAILARDDLFEEIARRHAEVFLAAHGGN